VNSFAAGEATGTLTLAMTAGSDTAMVSRFIELNDTTLL
jgi:hypothetical protein